MSSFIKKGLTKRSDDTMDDDNDDKDDSKRKSRNLSEKKRRDQFNMLINELSSMVSTNTRKMDKSTVLKSTISFLKNHNEIAVQSRAHEIQEDWKPSFLSNEEFTHLILEALDGFIMVFSSSGKIYYASESITSLLGYLPNDLLSMSIFDMVYEEDQSELYNILMNPANNTDNFPYETQITFNCHLKRGGLENKDQLIYESVQFDGYFRPEVDSTELDNISNSNFGSLTGESDTRIIFVGTGRLNTPLLLRDMSIVDSTKSEFTSRHSLEWKFLFLDHRAPPIIGYLPFEVLGTSGYDYYHVDDLEKVVICHEALMQKGEGTSCYYRFLTKGQQWIWLQTRFYITYHQWNSKPEFIVCTHRVVSYVDVMKQLFKNETEMSSTKDKEKSDESLQPSTTPLSHTVLSSPWSSKSSVCKRSVTKEAASSPSGSKGHSRAYIPGPGSDSTSMSADSPGSRQSQLTASSVKHLQQQQQPLLHHQQLQPERSKLPSSTSAFNEQMVVQSNPCQYVPAIPVQPTFPIPATLSTQDQIQEQLQRKHEELQQLIVAQQEELRRVSEQLFMARYGMLPPLQLNVSLPYSTPATVSSTTTAPMVPNQNTPVLVDPNQVNNIQLQNPEDGMVFQMAQQQTQLLFASPSHGHHNSQ